MAAVLAAGMALRLLFWLQGSAIRLDEARVALNLLDRGVLELLGPLARHQAEPWGLLVLQEGLGQLLGFGERVLRFPSLVCSLLSLPLFDAVARRYVDRRGRIVADALFAFSLFPFLSAGYGKQYAAAAFVTLLLWWAALTWGAESRSFFLLALVSLLFSFPAVFVAGGVYLVAALHRPGRDLLVRAAGFGAAAVLVAIGLEGTTTDPYLQEFWREHMLGSAEDPLSWTASHLLQFFENPVAVGAPVLGGGATLFGAWRLVREHGYRGWLPFGALPLLLAASALELWPLADRLLFFLAPLAILCTALPIGRLALPGPRGAAAAGLFGLLIVPGTLEVLNRTFREPTRWDMRTLTERFVDRYRPGDAVFVYLNAEPPLSYYLRLRDTTIPYETVSPEPEEAERVFEHGDPDRRSWWITSGEGPAAERTRLRRLVEDHTGPLVEHLTAAGADAYLYAAPSPPGGSGGGPESPTGGLP